MILPTVLKSNLIAQQVVSEGQKQKGLSAKKQAPVNGGGSSGVLVSQCLFAAKLTNPKFCCLLEVELH